VISRRLNWPVTIALLATLLLRSLVAPGYMPSNVGNGGLVDLCHSGLPAGVLQSTAAAAHHPHHAPGPASDEATQLTSDDLCPLGDALGSAALPTFHQQPGFEVRPSNHPADRRRPARTQRAALGFNARAPPFGIA
jgi:hypothetical protein